MDEYEGYVTDAGTSSTFERAYPIRVDVSHDLGLGESGELVLSKDEAARLAAKLVELINMLENRNYVQVEFEGADTGARAYTYYDPSGELAVGDKVIVPTRYNPEAKAEVVELGRGRWRGEASSVTAKLVTERVDL